MKPKKHKKNYFIPLFIMFIMIFSVAGFLWQGTNLTNNPSPTDTTSLDIPIDQITLQELNSAQKIYLSTEDNNIPSNFNLPLTPIVNRATYNEQVSIQQNIPLKTCDDATVTTKIILFNSSSNITEITYKDNCLVLKGNIQQATDKLINELLA